MLVELVVALVAFAVGAVGGWLVSRTRLGAQLQVAEARAADRELRIRELTEQGLQLHERFDKQLHAKDQEISLLQLQMREAESKVAASEARRLEEARLWESKLALLNEARDRLGDAFKSLSADIFKSSNQSFLTLAKETLAKFQAEARGDLEQRQHAVQALVQPIQQSLERVQEQIQIVEKTRAQAFGSLTEHINQVVLAQDKLRAETGNLVKALRTPQGRGRWGEIQLQRVVEMAGMLEHCDFQQQASVTTDDGKLRPDLIVKLPGGKSIVVDAKVPLAAYLEALEAHDDAARIKKLDEHAQQVRSHLTKLGAKQYWQQFQPAPEFVVLFLPGESFFSAALQQDPRLIEEGVNQQVIVATPTTLIALLRAVAYGWRQEAVAQHAQKVAALGQELYERIRAFSYHMAKVGSGLEGAVDSYNKAIGSLESRVLVSARRFKELGSASGQDLPEPDTVNTAMRQIEAPELTLTLGREREPIRLTPPPSADIAVEPRAPAPTGNGAAAAAPVVAAVVTAVAPEVEAASASAAEAIEPEPQVAAPEPPAPAVDPFPSLEELLAAPVEATPSLEEIMAVVGESQPAPKPAPA